MTLRHKALLGWSLGAAVAASKAGAEEFLVGVELPLTGGMARADSDNLAGLAVAAEVFNQRNSKHRIKLASIDNESQPAKAVAAGWKDSPQRAWWPLPAARTPACRGLLRIIGLR